jgi:hypothetical protein
MPEILLIDDDVARRASVEAALEAAGYRVRTFSRTADLPEKWPAADDAAGAPVLLAGHAPAAHALVRWARALVPIVECLEDPRTMHQWARSVAVSAGALRTWCRAGGVTPRRSLVFGRLLRAVCLGGHGRYRLENLLNVVDRRTLVGLLRFSGFRNVQDFPCTVEEFLARQTLVRDPAALAEITRALAELRQARARRAHLTTMAG